MNEIILEKIKQYEKIIILRHIDADGDAHGSSLGLASALKDNFPNKEIYVDGKNEKYLKFMGVTNYPLEKEKYFDSLLIVCDTSNKERIDTNYFDLAKESIKIDHHIQGGSYSNYEWIDSASSSCCEMISKFLLDFGLLVTKNTANLLATGMITDSGRFLYSSSQNTFKIFSFLLDRGADLDFIYKNLYLEDLNILKFRGHILNNFQITDSGIAFFKIDLNLLNFYHLDYNEAKNLVNIFSGVNQIKIWFLAIEKNPGLIKISLRSRDIVINEVAKKYRGGGHKLAAGALINDWTELNEFIFDLEKILI